MWARSLSLGRFVSGLGRIPESSVVIEIMTKKHQNESIELLSQMITTSETEPLATMTGITFDEFYEYCDLYFSSHLSHNLSVVAIDKDQNDKVVGCVFSEDYQYILDPLSPQPLGISELVKSNKKFQIVGKIHQILEEYYIEHCRRNGYEKIVHLFIGAVEESERGRGILKEMIEASETLAREDDFDVMFGICTNTFSHYSAFSDEQNILKINYDNFVHVDGTTPFRGCNDRAINWLKEKNRYREEFKNCCQYIWLDEILLK